MQGANVALDPEDCQFLQPQNASMLAAGENTYSHQSRYVAARLPWNLRLECYSSSKLHFVCLLQLADC